MENILQKRGALCDNAKMMDTDNTESFLQYANRQNQLGLKSSMNTVYNVCTMYDVLYPMYHDFSRHINPLKAFTTYKNIAYVIF